MLADGAGRARHATSDQEGALLYIHISVYLYLGLTRGASLPDPSPVTKGDREGPHAARAPHALYADAPARGDTCQRRGGGVARAAIPERVRGRGAQRTQGERKNSIS